MRIGMDAMGGDHAPREVVRGVVAGLRYLSSDDRLVLFGPRGTVEEECRAAGLADGRVQLIDAPQIIEMDEPPIEAVRQKRNSSIVAMAVAAGADQLDAVISAGNTGAFAAAAQLKIGALEGVSRPGIAVVMPTFHGPVLVCDVGANVAPKPHHLHEYARMSTIYARRVLGIANPRSGLISIGEETAKGSPLVKEAGKLIKADSELHFVGNVEGRDIFGGQCDVAVCDGFVGNVILKLTEGLAEGLFRTIVQEIKDESQELVPRFEPIVSRIWRRHDFAEYGGAPLLGIRKVVIICHGRSDARALSNAIRVAIEQERTGLIAAVAENLRGRHEYAP
ncbi:MAG: phosphate acyltransferase PlsX [Planctomycetota bacterium]